MMGVDYVAVLVASIVQFVIGAIWYMPIFGKAWGEIHGFKKMNKEEQKKAQKSMAPMLVVQFIGTVLTTLALAKLFALAPEYSIYKLSLVVWLGFFVPVQVSGVIFGGTQSKWIVKKSLIMAGGSFVCLLAAAAIIGNMQ